MLTGLRLATLVAVASAAASAPAPAESPPGAPVYSLVIARANWRAFAFVPALLIVETMPDRSKKVSFWTRGGSSRANFRCIGGSAFSDLAWHPAGPGVEMEGDAICADVTEIMRLPSSLSEVAPIQVPSPRELRRHLWRQKH